MGGAGGGEGWMMLEGVGALRMNATRGENSEIAVMAAGWAARSTGDR